jgi:hypothetical protein
MSRKWMGFALALCLVAGGGLVAEEKEKVPAVKKLEVKGFRVARPGRFRKPTVITSAKELARAVPGEGAQEKIEKQVDFDKQQVLMFSWAGSGRDRLSVTESEGKVVFHYKRGLTKDLRPHLYFFAVRKGVKYELPGRRR